MSPVGLARGGGAILTAAKMAAVSHAKAAYLTPPTPTGSMTWRRERDWVSRIETKKSLQFLDSYRQNRAGVTLVTPATRLFPEAFGRFEKTEPAAKLSARLRLGPADPLSRQHDHGREPGLVLAADRADPGHRSRRRPSRLESGSTRPGWAGPVTAPWPRLARLGEGRWLQLRLSMLRYRRLGPMDGESETGVPA
jgi:hypothetical protein